MLREEQHVTASVCLYTLTSLVPRLISQAFILQAIEAWERSLGEKPGREAWEHLPLCCEVDQVW